MADAVSIRWIAQEGEEEAVAAHDRPQPLPIDPPAASALASRI